MKKIYIDSDYKSFNMNCKINNIQPYYLLSPNNKEYKISYVDIKYTKLFTITSKKIFITWNKWYGILNWKRRRYYSW